MNRIAVFLTAIAAAGAVVGLNGEPDRAIASQSALNDVSLCPATLVASAADGRFYEHGNLQIRIYPTGKAEEINELAFKALDLTAFEALNATLPQAGQKTTQGSHYAASVVDDWAQMAAYKPCIEESRIAFGLAD